MKQDVLVIVEGSCKKLSKALIYGFTKNIYTYWLVYTTIIKARSFLGGVNIIITWVKNSSHGDGTCFCRTLLEPSNIVSHICAYNKTPSICGLQILLWKYIHNNIINILKNIILTKIKFLVLLMDIFKKWIHGFAYF